MAEAVQRTQARGSNLMRVVGPLIVPVALLALAAAVVLPSPVDTGARIRQHLVSLGLQIFAAVVASVLLWPTGSTGAEDRERSVWRRFSLASLLWAVGLLVYGMREWRGPGPSYPSVADFFLVGASLVYLAALLRALRLVRPWLSVWRGLLLAGLTAGLCAGAIAVLLGSVIAAPTDVAEKTLNLVYPALAILQISLAAGPVLARRGRLSRYLWVGVMLGTTCLALSTIGFVVLTSFDLYSDIHPINLLRIGGFAVLAGTGAWRRQTIAAIVAEGALIPHAEPRVPRTRKIWVRKDWRPWGRGPAGQPRQVKPARQVKPKPILPPARWPETIIQAQATREPRHRDRRLGLAALLLLIFFLGGALGASGLWVALQRVRNSEVSQKAPERQAAPVVQAPSLPVTPPAEQPQYAFPVTPQLPVPPPQVPAQMPPDPIGRQPPQTEPSPPVTQPSPGQRPHRVAEQLMSQGRFREAQDEYLGILVSLGSPDDEAAMKGLITARRRLANDDPALLRRQAQSYMRAIEQGVETDEHYTRRALQVLAQASLAAAREIEAARRPRP